MEKPVTNLNKRLADIQSKLKAPKSQFNKFANFNYRSCEDILEAVKPMLDGLTLTISDEIVYVGERYYVKATITLGDGTETVSSCAYAREADVKTGMDSAQITGSASSYARKYCLNGLFAIDDTKDADTQDNTTKEPFKQIKKTNTSQPSIPITTADDDLDLSNIDEEIAKEVKYQVKKEVVHTGDDMLKQPARDTKGHVYCQGCGIVVSQRVEKYSTEKHGKPLCMACQLKMKGKK